METPELLARIDERQQHMEEKFDNMLELCVETRDLAKATNGRVTKLEIQTVKVEQRLDKTEEHTEDARLFRERVRATWQTVLIIATGAGFIISTILHFI